MEIKSKHIKNIELVEKFRKILFFQLSLPFPLLVILIIVQFMMINIISGYIITLLYILLGLVIGAAVLFTPYIIYVLIKEYHIGWTITFFVMNVLPYPIVYFIMKDSILLVPWLLTLTILFYLYCFLIKFSVDEWLKEYRIEQQIAEQRNEWEEKKKEWLI